MATQHNIHIGQMIKTVFEESGISVAELARRIHTTRSNIYFIFERQSIDMEQLLNLCDALNHDFLNDLQIHRGIKPKINLHDLHVDLYLKDLSEEKIVKIEHFLDDLKKEKSV